MTSSRRIDGFTIVELLIVIVVIGILAAITIVSYRGVNQRAYNIQVVEGARQYHTAIMAYYADKGRYPQTQRDIDGENIAMTCLGSGYVDNSCGVVSGHETFGDPIFNAQMSTFLGGGLPRISNSNLTVDSESFIGAVYGRDTTDPAWSGGYPYALTIQYALMGEDQNCVLSGAYAYRFDNNSKTTACEIIFESYDAR